MPQIRTIEMDYEYQMARAIEQLLRRNKKTVADFATPEAMIEFLWEHHEEFGEIVLERMGNWATDEDWAETLSNKKDVGL